MAVDAFYFEKLNREEKEAYHAILCGLKEIAPSFSVPALSMKELSDLFLLVRLDHPEIFYASGFSCRWAMNAGSMEMIPEYTMKKKQIEEHRKAIEARLTRLLRPMEGKKEREKEKYVHDFICTKVRYDALKKPYSHEIIGPLTQGVGVCEGIAKSVKILLDRMGIWCVIAICDADPEHDVKYRHTWNIVRIGGQYYHLDATFDLSAGTPEKPRYIWYNVSDGKIFRDHGPVMWPVPACPKDERENLRGKH